VKHHGHKFQWGNRQFSVWLPNNFFFFKKKKKKERKEKKKKKKKKKKEKDQCIVLSYLTKKNDKLSPTGPNS
jgi:hypothetical protein